ALYERRANPRKAEARREARLKRTVRPMRPPSDRKGHRSNVVFGSRLTRACRQGLCERVPRGRSATANCSAPSRFWPHVEDATGAIETNVELQEEVHLSQDDRDGIRPSPCQCQAHRR